MVTRKVAEHKTPISDLLGGQIKSFLTTSGNKTSASIQPFFTLQLDVQVFYIFFESCSFKLHWEILENTDNVKTA
nr:ubiquitin carboxyl-terminal hydrolase 10-like [Parasteatoda tepidariorum]